MKNIPLIMQLIKEANETAQAADRKVSSAEGDSEMSFNTATSASNVTQTAKNVRLFFLFKVFSSLSSKTTETRGYRGTERKI